MGFQNGASIPFGQDRGQYPGGEVVLFIISEEVPEAAIDSSQSDAKTQAVIENLKPACICNKIRKGTVLKAIQAGAKTFEQISKRTGVGTGPCGGRRCGSLVRGLLGEPVTTCNDCGWPVLVGSLCPRCEYAKQES